MTSPSVPPPLSSVPPPLLRSKSTGAHADDRVMRLILPVGRSGWAIAAGYFGLFSVLILPAPLAVIFSVMAIVDLRKCERLGKRRYGMGRAVFGLVMGSLGTLMLPVIWWLLHPA